MPPLPLPAQAPRLVPSSEIVARPVEWLWPGHLAPGKLAVLDGDPGMSKSFVALDLCARLSAGQPWPDGTPGPAPAASIFLNGEDNPEDTITPRLDALGADRARVFLIDRGDGDLAMPLTLPGQVAVLEALVEQAQARLLVIDPILAFFGPGVNTSSDASVRRALDPLAALARRQGCAVLMIRHLTKLARGRAMYRGLGAIGLIGTCRLGWLVAEEAEGSGRRVLAQLKSNLSAPQPSLAFEVVQPEGRSPIINWLGPVSVTADDLQGQRRRPGREPVALAAAMTFLSDVLAAGPLRVSEVWARARAEGVSRGTLKRAKDEMEVQSAYVSEDGRPVSYWLLSHQEPPSAGPAEDDENSVEPWLAAQRRRFPGPCPLDDL